LPVESRRENVVAVLPTTGARRFGPFNDELAKAVADNVGKLSEVGDLERHLAILVDRFDAEGDPVATPPPALPPAIDCLWIVHRWRGPDDMLAVWLARAGDSAWRVHVVAEAEG
jgi:hypothetical protein